MNNTVKHYTDEFKFKVVKEYLETDASQTDLMVKYGIRGCGCIPNWIRKFGLAKPTKEQIKLREVMREQTTKGTREIELEAKVRELEKALEHEQLKSLALDTMIDVAERDLKITIRKKPGAKQ
jgi:transposase-like protein